MTYQGVPYVPKCDFIPSTHLIRPDGDVSIIFLAGNGVIFGNSMDDDWYRATGVYEDLKPGPSNDASVMQYNIPVEAASPLGCVQQWQWCNSAYPVDRGCGPLASSLDAYYGAAPLCNITAATLHSTRPSSPDATATRLLWPAMMQLNNPPTLDEVLSQLGAKSLSSQPLMYRGVQPNLPTNQWQLDVTHWWNIILASVQGQFVDTAVGPTDLYMQEHFTIHPGNDEERKLCNSQVGVSTHQHTKLVLEHDRARNGLLMLCQSEN
jgi:hypothetical protein